MNYLNLWKNTYLIKWRDIADLYGYAVIDDEDYAILCQALSEEYLVEVDRHGCNVCTHVSLEDLTVQTLSQQEYNVLNKIGILEVGDGAVIRKIITEYELEDTSGCVK